MSQWESVFGKDIISKVFSLDMEIKQTAMIALSTEIVSIIKSQFKERVKIHRYFIRINKFDCLSFHRIIIRSG